MQDSTSYGHISGYLVQLFASGSGSAVPDFESTTNASDPNCNGTGCVFRGIESGRTYCAVVYAKRYNDTSSASSTPTTGANCAATKITGLAKPTVSVQVTQNPAVATGYLGESSPYDHWEISVTDQKQNLLLTHVVLPISGLSCNSDSTSCYYNYQLSSSNAGHSFCYSVRAKRGDTEWSDFSNSCSP